MSKKDYVLKVLSVMKDTWPIAEWLSYLVGKNALDDTVLEVLVKILQYSLDKATDEIEKEKLLKAQNIFNKLKESEKAQQQLDDQDIKKLDELISTL